MGFSGDHATWQPKLIIIAAINLNNNLDNLIMMPVAAPCAFLNRCRVRYGRFPIG